LRFIKNDSVQNQNKYSKLFLLSLLKQTNMNLSQLHKDFGTQKKCIAYLEKIRWGKNPTCANCESPNVTKRKEGMRWHCNS
jgi:hypothetical protein